MKQNKQKSAWSWFWSITKGGRGLYVISLLLIVINLLFLFLFPQMIGFVVDKITGNIEISKIPIIQQVLEWMHANLIIPDHLLLISGLTLLVALADAVTSFLSKWLATISSEGIIKRLRDCLYYHIQHLPYEWHVNVQTGDIIQRCTSDVERIRLFITEQLTEMVRTILIIIVAYTILFPMNRAMAVASIAFLPIVLAFSILYLWLMARQYKKAEEAEGTLMSIAQENLTGVRVVRAFGKEQAEVEYYANHNEAYSSIWKRIGVFLGLYDGIAEFAILTQMLIVCLIGVQQAAMSQLTPGTFIVFLSYNSMVIWPVRSLGRIFSEASKTKVATDRIWEILQTPVEKESPNALTTPISGDIVFDHVSFSFPEQEVLHNVSFTVREGTTLGILGATGSGKSTIAHLLCRLYDLGPNHGTITIGGVNIEDYNRQWLRRNVGIVLQEPYLFSRSIAENIAALSPSPTLSHIRHAAQIASVDNDIMQFTDGYETMVGERGVSLSGGQRQRVAISRIILSNPPVMIFDDSLSAVDTQTDANIRRALKKQRETTTTIIISHRVLSLSDADYIIVLEDGEIAEEGTHGDLLEKCGIYSRIYFLQESTQEEEEDSNANNRY